MPGLDNTRLFMSFTAGAGTRCMSLLSRARHKKPQQEEEEGILQLEYISFILHLLGSHLQSGPEVGGN